MRRVVCSLSIALWAFAAPGCGGERDEQARPERVTASRPLREVLIEWDEYPGHLESPEIVNVAARVSGVIESAPFEEGAMVAAGDLLYVIDPRPFEAELLSREADVAGARSNLAQASAQFSRYRKLKGAKAVSEQDYDLALANFRQAEAQVGVAEAAREIAKLNLDWTRVSAPIAGKIGRKLVTEGNQISGGGREATTLTVITSLDPIYCYVNVPERAYLEYRELSWGRSDGGLSAWIKLENEKSFRRRGRIDFVDNRVDRETGTLTFRAVFPNRAGELTPGLFATLRIPGSEPYEATLVPDSAVGTSQDSRFLLVVGGDGSVEERKVELGALFGPFRAIREGLRGDELVVTRGVSRARPGERVEAEETELRVDALAEFRPASTHPGGA